jgi:hypothetical protein
MKIIKQGREQKGWAAELPCTGGGNGEGGCGAILLVESTDLFLTYNHVHTDTDEFVTFKCMACGVLTDIKHPTPDMRREARKNERPK